MPTLTFFGRVLPETHSVTASNIPAVQWAQRSDPAFHATLRATIAQSAVTIECEMQNDPGDISALYVHAIDFARAVVNLIAFREGWPLIVVLDAIERNGQRTLLLPRNAALEGLCTAFDLTHDFDAVRNIVLEDPVLAVTLDDLIRTISTPHYAPIGSARVLDGLRHLIAPGKPDGEQWRELRNALNLDESYLKFVTNASKDHRHGKRTRIEGDVTQEITIRTWVVMNRFLEFRKRGSRPLPMDSFPQLVDGRA